MRFANSQFWFSGDGPHLAWPQTVIQAANVPRQVNEVPADDESIAPAAGQHDADLRRLDQE